MYHFNCCKGHWRLTDCVYSVDGALNVWDLRVPNQAISSSIVDHHSPKRGIGAATMSSTSVFAQYVCIQSFG